MTETKRPVKLGILLGILGFALLCGGVYLNIQFGGGDYYFVVLGIFVAISGLLLTRGSKIALAVYACALITVYGWAFLDESYQGTLVGRAIMPTIIGAYLFFSKKVRNALAN